ncbi:MAG: GC-type dockerin domain-anchored protein [Phycisphaerales bacterium]
MKRGLGAIVVGMMSAAAVAQSAYRLEITVEPESVRPGETATIRLLAHFDGSRDCAISTVITDLMVSVHAPSIGARRVLPPMDFLAVHPGTIDAAGVRDIVAFQIQGLADIVADPTNPMPFWEGAFVAPEVDDPQRIVMATRTAHYFAYPDCCSHCHFRESRLDEIAEAFAEFWIVPCEADLDGDGELTVFDFLAFQNLFDAGDLAADFDGDGELTIFDFLAFQNAFMAGCP